MSISINKPNINAKIKYGINPRTTTITSIIKNPEVVEVEKNCIFSRGLEIASKIVPIKGSVRSNPIPGSTKDKGAKYSIRYPVESK